MKSLMGCCLALAALLAMAGCAPMNPPQTVEPATEQVQPPAAQPKPTPQLQLFQEMKSISDRAEASDLRGEESYPLQAEMDLALKHYFEAPADVQRDPQVQGALERMTDLALQLALEYNARPEGQEDTPAPSPLEDILELTTFLSPEDLKKTYQDVQSGMLAVPMDFPMEVNDSVLSYVNLYETRLKEWFTRALTRGAPHMLKMKEIFKEEGVPTSLVYLSIVESACNPKAKSRANAVGMWQFIAGTAKRYDLTVDFWEDGRLDPERSARASARYLKDLYDAFGDWHLALAAYNCGEGRIQRHLNKHPEADFWSMRDRRNLVKETREYVPAILGAIIVASNPKAYGMDVPEESAPEPTAEIVIEEATDLRVLAKCADVSVEKLQDMNPSLKRMMSPPRPFTLKIPVQSEATFAEAFKSIPPEEKMAVKMHTVSKKETLKSVARRYGVSSEAIRIANGLPSRKLKAGQTLIIPLGMAAADPSSFAEVQPKKAKKAPHSKTYKVRKGDTLASIARRTGVPIDTLKSLNSLESGQVKPGQRLVLVYGSSSAKDMAKKSGPPQTGKKKVHKVIKGDTLYEIARKYGKSVDALCRANRISKSKRLQPGDMLIIP